MKKSKLVTCGIIALAVSMSLFAKAPEVVNPIVDVDGMEVSSYIRTWGLGSTVKEIDRNKHWKGKDVKGEYLTEIIVAFAHIDPTTWGLKFPDVDGEKHTFPKLWDEVAYLQAKYPHLKMNVSVGGYGADDFSPMAADPAKREAFIKACVDLVKDKNLNGIDIDWEYPIGPDWGQEIKSSPDDGKNYITLLKELRAAFDAVEEETGRYISISIAVPASSWFCQKNDVKNLSSIVDSLKLMAYDYYGSWSGQTGHTANLYNNPKDPDWGGWSTDQALNDYLKAGVPSKKIVLGVAFYGRAWAGVEPGPNGDGLYQKYKEATYPDGLSWSQMDKFFKKNSKYVRYWDDVAKAPYLYNGDEFITYTDPEAVTYIGKYARDKNLGGVMVWEYGHDMDCELFPVLVNSIAPEPDPSAEVSEK